MTEAFDRLVVAADEPIAACRAVPVPANDPTLVELPLPEVRKRITIQAESSSEAAISSFTPPIPTVMRGAAASRPRISRNLPAYSTFQITRRVAQ